MSFIFDVLGEKCFSSDLINFFEMLIHDGKSSIVSIEIIGRICDCNRNLFTHFCDSKITASILKLGIANELNFILRIDRGFIIEDPLLAEFILTLDSDIMDFGLNFQEVILDKVAFFEECGV